MHLDRRPPDDEALARLQSIKPIGKSGTVRDGMVVGYTTTYAISVYHH